MSRVAGAEPAAGSEASQLPAGTRARRILMIAPTSFFGDYGCHVRILEETRTLERMGHSVAIVTYRNGRDLPGLDVRRTPPIPWRTGYEVGSSRHKLAFDVFLSAASFAAAVRFKPDIVHGHLHEGALIGAAVSRAVRRPLVFDFQGSLSDEMIDHGFLRPGGRAQALVRRLERAIDHMPDAIVTSSHRAVDHLVDEFDVPRERVSALPDCVDAAVFRPDALDAQARRALLSSLGVPPDRRIVVYLGLLARHQGTNVLLHAARRVLSMAPSTHFLVMGYPGTEYYNARAYELGLADNVTFTGRVPYENAPQHLALGEIALAPKRSATEGSGKLLNYMAAGLPTVAFDLPVNRDFLGDCGVYVADGDAVALGDAVVRLLGLPREELASVGRRLRQRAVDQFGWDRAGRALTAVYDRVERERAA